MLEKTVFGCRKLADSDWFSSEYVKILAIALLTATNILA
jgi:hypothetical protein